MKVLLKPLYSQLNTLECCPLRCQKTCEVSERSELKPTAGNTCPLSLHQVETYAEINQGTADVIFNTATTGDGKSLAAYLPGLLTTSFRIMGLYPTIELVEDQDRSHRDEKDKDGNVIRKGWHSLFGLNTEKRIDRLFGEELSRRVQAANSNRFQELRIAIENKPIILTNPDIFHLITHFQYRDPAYENSLVPLLLAEFPDLWVFDEFHIFGPHQEAAVLNSLSFIRRSQQRQRRFLFTSATPKQAFINQLKAAGFNSTVISGSYADRPLAGYRQILQQVELEFVELKKQDVLGWLHNHTAEIAAALNSESCGRGLIILNSIAQAGRAVELLRASLPDVDVQEISGRMDRTSRQETQEKLKHSERPVLVIGTSAVDVGIDFKIHLLIFESSDSATVIQRLGRIGRHSDFQYYKALALLPENTSWILPRLQLTLQDGEEVDRQTLQAAITEAFDPPKEFEEYQREWGVLQTQAMLWQIGKDNQAVTAGVRSRILQDLQPIYGTNLESVAYRQLQDYDQKVASAIQDELLRFPGSTAIQAAVWDENRFYTYDLLRLLPYTFVEVLDEAEFLDAARHRDYPDFSFQYAQVFLRVQKWVSERIDIRLRTDRDSSELKCCELILLSKLKIDNHPQSNVMHCLNRKQILSFLIPGVYSKVRESLRLGSLFGLYPLTDSSEQTYACAFNQDALLLKALKKRMTKLCRQNSTSRFF